MIAYKEETRRISPPEHTTEPLTISPGIEPGLLGLTMATDDPVDTPAGKILPSGFLPVINNESLDGALHLEKRLDQKSAVLAEITRQFSILGRKILASEIYGSVLQELTAQRVQITRGTLVNIVSYLTRNGYLERGPSESKISRFEYGPSSSVLNSSESANIQALTVPNKKYSEEIAKRRPLLLERARQLCANNHQGFTVGELGAVLKLQGINLSSSTLTYELVQMHVKGLLQRYTPSGRYPNRFRYYIGEEDLKTVASYHSQPIDLMSNSPVLDVDIPKVSMAQDLLIQGSVEATTGGTKKTPSGSNYFSIPPYEEPELPIQKIPPPRKTNRLYTSINNDAIVPLWRKA